MDSTSNSTRTEGDAGPERERESGLPSATETGADTGAVTPAGSASDPVTEPDVDLDDVDRRLLDALLADGRASAADLSAAAGVATATATRRRKQLEESGVVERYRPVVDLAALGFDVTAVFRLDIDGDGIAEVVADLQATGRMVSVYEVTGAHDVVAVGKFANTDELERRIRALSTHPHVRRANTNVVLETVAEDDPLPVADGG